MCDYCTWIEQVLSKISDERKIKRKKVVELVEPIIIVHGGAGRIPKDEREYMLTEVKNAAVTAYKMLLKGQSSVDAVEGAIRHMENERYFNCGKGGSLDTNNEIVMDAAIMADGYRAGCVGAVRDIQHPITLARKVMENTEHVLIVENGAQRFAADAQLPILPPACGLNAKETWSNDTLSTKEKRGNEETLIKFSSKDEEKSGFTECEPSCIVPNDLIENRCMAEAESVEWNDPPEVEPSFLQVDAVGAVAFDRIKRLASGTSTAGNPGKPIGSVSAVSTVIGCGVYVAEHGCASVSGEDKSIYYFAPALKIVRGLKHKKEIGNAVTEELKHFESETGESHIGAVALNGNGEPFVYFKCMHFPWAYCRKGYIHYGCSRHEKFSERINIIKRPSDCMCEYSN